MTTGELIANLLGRMQEVDIEVAERTRTQPFGAQDYQALWHAISFELALAHDDE
jgi:hypothetical protein